jgi:hypothetical protein
MIPDWLTAIKEGELGSVATSHQFPGVKTDVQTIFKEITGLDGQLVTQRQLIYN